MSATYQCDGCREPVAEPVYVGKVLRRDYCAGCAVKAEKFIEAEEDLRKRTQERFRADRALLISNMSAGGFRLPDVPDADHGT